MYYFVFNNLFVSLIIFGTSHIGPTVSQDAAAAGVSASPAASPTGLGDAEELKNLREQYNALKTDNEYLKQESLDLNRRADELQNRLDVLERLNEETARVNRRNNVVVYGIPNSAIGVNEKANTLVKKLGDAINFPLTDKDIVDAYRLTSTEKGLRHGGDPLLIKFTNTDVKDLFMKKMKLQDINAGLFGGDSTQKLFVNEHLTKQASAIFREALALKSHGYPYIWTKNGHVYAKKVGDDMPSIRIESIDQANQMLREARGEKNINEPNPPPS